MEITTDTKFVDREKALKYFRYMIKEKQDFFATEIKRLTRQHKTSTGKYFDSKVSESLVKKAQNDTKYQTRIKVCFKDNWAALLQKATGKKSLYT